MAFWICVAVAFGLNWLVFVPSYVARTERYFDLTGAATYLTVTALALLLADDLDTRSYVLGALVAVWALRLGTFLFRRVVKAGHDRRFDKIKNDVKSFFITWTLQGLWVSLTAGAALAAITSENQQSFGALGFVGLGIWLAGFAIEVVADAQKSRFRSDPANSGRFITTGLWAWSRHPNYFGEIVLWVGVALIALPALDGLWYLTLVSPLFVTLLLTRISGIPMLERGAAKRWGDEPEYRQYVQSTPVLVPRPPR